jgi:hypothetical protein
MVGPDTKSIVRRVLDPLSDAWVIRVNIQPLRWSRAVGGLGALYAPSRIRLAGPIRFPRVGPRPQTPLPIYAGRPGPIYTVPSPLVRRGAFGPWTNNLVLSCWGDENFPMTARAERCVGLGRVQTARVTMIVGWAGPDRAG